MSFFGKEFKHYKQENCDALWKYLGAPDEALESANSNSVPPEKIVQDGDSYTIFTEGAKGPIEIKFKPGVEFDDDFGDDTNKAKSTIVIDGNTVTQTIKSDKYVAYAKREFNGNDLVITMWADGFDGVAKRFYKA